MFFIKVKKTSFFVFFYLQVNVFNIYVTHSGRVAYLEILKGGGRPT